MVRNAKAKFNQGVMPGGHSVTPGQRGGLCTVGAHHSKSFWFMIKAEESREWQVLGFVLIFAGWPLQDFGHRNETLAQSTCLHQHYSFPTSATLEPFFLPLANPQAPAMPKPSRQMKGSGSIFSKRAPWYFMKSLLTGPTLQLKNTFWRPAEPVSGTGIKVIPSPTPSRSSPGRSFICSHPLLSAPSSPCRSWAALLLQKVCNIYSLYIPLCSCFRKIMDYNIPSIK